MRRHLLHAWLIAVLAALAVFAMGGCDDEGAGDDPTGDTAIVASTDTGATAPETTVTGDLTDAATCGARPGPGFVCCRDGAEADLVCVDGMWTCPDRHVYVQEFECRAEPDVVEPPAPGCDTCSGSEWCDFDDDGCGTGAAAAQCRPLPSSCDPVSEPVCGCDGQVHLNPCYAQAEGVDVALDNDCSPPPGTIRCGTSFCQATAAYCEVVPNPTGPGIESARCVSLPDGCYDTAEISCACLQSDPCGGSCEEDPETGGLTLYCR